MTLPPPPSEPSAQTPDGPQAPIARTSTAPPEPPKERSNRRRNLWVFGIVGLVALLLVAGSCAAYIFLLPSGLEQTVPIDAQVGECYGNEGTMQPISCDEPHRFYVFSAAEFEESDYPARYEAMLGNTVCNEDFEALTGESVTDLNSTFDYGQIYTSEEDWANGDRYAVCGIFDLDRRVLPSRFHPEE